MSRKPKVLTLILAGGKGSRLGTLTENRAKPVMPFAGFYRLIDFALSNCMHSDLSDVWVIEQYQLHSLNEHLSNGRPWDLDRTYGGLQVLPPNQSQDEANDESGFASGNADAIYRHRSFISNFAPDILIVLSADHIYKLDFRDVIEQHIKHKADVTMVTTKVPPKESASRFGVVKTDENGRIVDFAYKPEKPESDLITTEVFVYDAPKLLATLDELAEQNQENGEAKLKDFGHELIPQLVESGNAFEFRFNGYWRDVGTIESYWQSHMDLLFDSPEKLLDDPDWFIVTLAPQRVPARIYETAQIDNSLISPGCTIRGRVVRSVLASGVTVEEGAEICDSVILEDAFIGKNVLINRAIVDSNVRINKGVSARKAIPDEKPDQSESTEIKVFGQDDEARSKTKASANAASPK